LSDSEAYPITVELRHLCEDEAVGGASSNSGLWRSNAFDLPDDPALGSRANGIVPPGETETVHAKYVIGCDGARSWTREQLGYRLEGDSANVYVRCLHTQIYAFAEATQWGVVDTVPVTNVRPRLA
jgi:phenol 2-monooxygenase